VCPVQPAGPASASAPAGEAGHEDSSE
jgi:hypothetical protein